MIRPLQAHRYFPPSCVALIGFPLALPGEFSSSVPEPGSESRPRNTGHHMPNKWAPAMLFLGRPLVPSFDVAWSFRYIISGSLSFVSLIHTCSGLVIAHPQRGTVNLLKKR